MKLRYRAFDSKGQPSVGVIEADSDADAMEKLRKQGLYATEITADGARTSGAKPVRMAGGHKRLRNLAIMMREMSVLVSSGTPVVQALGALERQVTDDKWRDVINGVRTRVEEGSTMSEAMAEFPTYFDPVSRSMIAAGESSGQLDAMLERLAMMTRQRAYISSSLMGAMIYPALLVTVSISVMIVMMVFVLPRFAGLFETLDAPLPPTTKILMSISAVLRSYWWAMLVGIGALGFAARTWAGSASGKRRVDSLIIDVPVFGKIIRNFAVARIARVLGVLIKSRVPLLDALQLTRESTTNTRYAALIADAEEAVTRGEAMSTVFNASDLVLPSMAEAVRNAEQSGRVGEVLVHVADFMDQDNDVIIRSLTSIIEPIILIGLGIMVAFVAISLFLPLFDLTSMTQGGG